MIRNVPGLARYVDMLFRARQDGRQMPVGEVSREDGRWTPEAPESAAYRMAGILESFHEDAGENSCHYFWTADGRFQCFTNRARHLRTRRHVAMLALTEPEHFRSCVKAVSLIRVTRRGNLKIMSAGKASDAALIARTARYLQDLDARLTAYRGRGQRAAIETGRAADAEPPQPKHEPMDRVDEAALLQID